MTHEIIRSINYIDTSIYTTSSIDQNSAATNNIYRQDIDVLKINQQLRTNKYITSLKLNDLEL